MGTRPLIASGGVLIARNGLSRISSKPAPQPRTM